eukprot:TRINITY_DN17451_c0_g4_i1.p1 TRINITY_DN17451_c0_g4~~TRINITY_DN17451_c0_g4_i1.p1  ORF type:complete len:271 (+),score=59.74 TRINITY_DN17451_c0_g4_i1:60-872(+)
MSRSAVIVAACFATAAPDGAVAATARGRGAGTGSHGIAGFLSLHRDSDGGRNSMQPDIVAQTLASVEDEWKGQALVFAECSASNSQGGEISSTCRRAHTAFQKSCSVVANAVVQASGGDRATAKEYMSDVCSQEQLQGWHRDQCWNFSSTLVNSMSEVNVDNRESLAVPAICSKFFTIVSDAERERIARDRAEDEAREKEAEKASAEEASRKAEEEKKARQAETASEADAEGKVKEPVDNVTSASTKEGADTVVTSPSSSNASSVNATAL